MSKEPRPLSEAQERMAILFRELGPFCQRLEPAGSVRRMKPMVGDIELVCLPIWEKRGGLFGDQEVNLLWSYLQGPADVRWLKGNREDGRYYQLQTDDGWQVDLFVVHEPDAWGWLWLMRTGNSAFSQSILTRWKRINSSGPDQPGSLDGRLVHRDGTPLATPTEQSVFDAVRLRFIPPEERTGPVP